MDSARAALPHFPIRPPPNESATMRHFDSDALVRLLPWPALIDALRDAFAGDVQVPLRQHHTVPVPGEPDATLLLMPAWQPGGVIGVKLVTVMPGNGSRGLPAVHGLYTLFDGTTGELRALLDGATLTVRRTAAASALAARFLGRADARRLLIVGTGALAPNLAAAHAAVRPYEAISVWGRHPEKAQAVAQALVAAGLPARPVTDLETAVGEADVVSCATLSTEPLVRGHWLQPGAHVDLVGAFTPAMRESDDEVMRRGTVFVDTRAGATHEGGDIVQAMASGALDPSDIAAELAELCRSEHPGRRSQSEITVFKSVGTALEDLAAAALAVRNTQD